MFSNAPSESRRSAHRATSPRSRGTPRWLYFRAPRALCFFSFRQSVSYFRPPQVTPTTRWILAFTHACDRTTHRELRCCVGGVTTCDEDASAKPDPNAQVREFAKPDSTPPVFRPVSLFFPRRSHFDDRYVRLLKKYSKNGVCG